MSPMYRVFLGQNYHLSFRWQSYHYENQPFGGQHHNLVCLFILNF